MLLLFPEDKLLASLLYLTFFCSPAALIFALSVFSLFFPGFERWKPIIDPKNPFPNITFNAVYYFSHIINMVPYFLISV